jgi:hypothetical protein
MIFKLVGEKYTCKMYVKKFRKGLLKEEKITGGKINFTES